MCFSISDVINVNQFFGDCFTNERICPFPTMDDLESSCSWQRKNDLKCTVAGGCTFAGGIVATLGGWPFIITGAFMGCIGNLASYRYTRTTQEQLDHDANVKMLVEERASILSRISKLEELYKDEKEAKIIEEKQMKKQIVQLEKALEEYQHLLAIAQKNTTDKKE